VVLRALALRQLGKGRVVNHAARERWAPWCAAIGGLERALDEKAVRQEVLLEAARQRRQLR
jgi:hypothetical protein